jgi:hypothetical protein
MDESINQGRSTMTFEYQRLTSNDTLKVPAYKGRREEKGWMALLHTG